jgi:X-Pro dipeptidyl-peptidase
VTGDYNTFWDGRDYLQDADNIQAAVLVSHAFNDWNVMPGQSLRLYDALKARGIPAQVFFHQGGHGGSPSLAMMNRWFTRYVLDIDNGVENDPRAWIVREGPDAFDPTPYADFPNPDAVAVTLHPIAGGERNGGLTIDSASEQGVETLVDDVSRDGGALARAATSPHRLIYATPPLQTPVHISGVPTVRIRTAADRSAANLSVWLVSLPWADGGEITDNIITRSWADPQNHDGMERGAPLVPGMFYDVEFPLQPDDQIIPAGQRIGLMIFSSDQEFTLHPEPGTRLSVDLDGTTVQLPVVGGEGALGAAIGSSNLN